VQACIQLTDGLDETGETAQELRLTTFDIVEGKIPRE
jgi:hypothetical protein